MRARILGLDIASVGVFVAIGHSTHDETETSGSLIETAAPFLIALAVGWVLTRAWRQPVAWWTGIGVVSTTVVIGMALRRLVFDDGTAGAFVVVATLFLGVFLVGWRAIALRFVANLH